MRDLGLFALAMFFALGFTYAVTAIFSLDPNGSFVVGMVAGAVSVGVTFAVADR